MQHPFFAGKLIVYDIQNYRLQPVNLSVGKIKTPAYILLIIFS